MLRWCVFAVLLVAVLANKKTKPPKTTTAATTVLPDVPNPNDASAFCFACRSRRNHKDLYADPANCHNYYQCFYVNETYAIGFLRNCPAGQFWHDSVMTCMPEGATPCVDACLSDATSANKCYAGSGCRQFFVCSNTGSYGMCCPAGTQFNSATCACDESASCSDACVQAGPAIPTSVAPATQYNSTVCRDSYGRYISTVAGVDNAYVQIDVDGHATEQMYCAAGTSFDLGTCRCNIDDGATVPSIVQNRRVILFLPFNPEVKDYSPLHFSVFLFPDAARDTTTSFFGGASLAINGGRLEIPGLKSYDLRNHATWAGAFRCNGACQTGAILSNNKDSSASEFTIIAYVQGTNTFVARVNLWHPVGTVTVQSTFTTPASGWNFFAVTYDGNAVRLYINGALADTEFAAGFLTIAHCPYVVGTDQSVGTFNGNVDTVFIAPVDYTNAEIELFRAGNINEAINDGLLIAYP